MTTFFSYGQQGRRNGGARGARALPNFFKGLKVPFFVMKSALFVQANVAVNTKLTSKVPFLFGNFHVFLKKLVKNVQFWYGMTGKFFSSPPPVANISGKKFLGALFNIYPKVPLETGAPPNLLMLPTRLMVRKHQNKLYLFHNVVFIRHNWVPRSG